MGIHEGENVQTNIDSQQKKSSFQRKKSKSINEKRCSTISIEDARKNWPFTRLDGALLEKLHKQAVKATYGEALL